MLRSELSGTAYNKSEHRRRLQPLLRGRTDGAIERKHQNISAILQEVGFPPIPGYKPLVNYQQDLRDVVVARLLGDSELQNLAARDVEAAATVPAVIDVLDAWVAPPRPMEPRRAPGVAERRPLVRNVDYLAREAMNRSLGDAGEAFVLRYERARLVRAGQERLADRVDHVSRTRGDGLGYDILSYETSGKERLIEVKTTRYGAYTPFFVSSNELQVSRAEAESYHLYRVHEFRSRPRLFTVSGSLSEQFHLEASQFLARIPAAPA
jgi:hypothetical protein